jgi:hypothetical protein
MESGKRAEDCVALVYKRDIKWSGGKITST